MCCLFGLLDYKQRLSLDRRQEILRTLSIACEERGTDATGIAYFKGKRLYIQKAPRAAHRMKFHLGQEAKYIMGHTRMTTQGDEKKNYNNHPFPGRAGKTLFALAHNGVIHNDKTLQVSRRLPYTKIETDSYIAAQLLEQEKTLGFAGLRNMAEELQGTFTITVLDARNNLYIVKGNNPMCIYQFKSEGFYLYASTQEILDRAIKRLGLDKRPHKNIRISSGEILRIAADGSLKKGYFNDSALWSMSPVYSLWGWDTPYARQAEKDALSDMLELYSQISGYSYDALAMLHDSGFDLMDIEQMIYDPELMEDCLAEVQYSYG